MLHRPRALAEGRGNAAGKLNDGFSSRNIAKQAGERLERRKLAIRIEYVEFSLIRRERGSRILAGGIFARQRSGFGHIR